MKVARALLAVLAVPAFAQDGLGGTLPPAAIPGDDIADPIAAAVAGLSPIEIEDDLGTADSAVTGIVTHGCTTVFTTRQGQITVDWRKIEHLGPADTFVYLQGEGFRFALIGDASRPDQAQKLANVHAAMQAMRQRCR